MPFQGIGNVQTTKYGSRVRVRVGYKDIYGPYRRTVDCARLDLAKLHGEHRSSEEKKALLLQLKLAIGVRRGGRHRSYCRGNDNVDVGEVQDMDVYQAMLSSALGSDISDVADAVDEAAGQPSSSSENPHIDDDVVLPVRTEVDREGEVAPINIGSCPSAGPSKNRVEAGASKKTEWKQVRCRFLLARWSKQRRRKRWVGEGTLDKVPGTPDKRNMAPVCQTPEKPERAMRR